MTSLINDLSINNSLIFPIAVKRIRRVDGRKIFRRTLQRGLFRDGKAHDRAVPVGRIGTCAFWFQLSVMDKKLDQLMYVQNALAQKQQIPLRSIEDDV